MSPQGDTQVTIAAYHIRYPFTVNARKAYDIIKDTALEDIMANMTVRNLPDDVHRRIKAIAAQRGISTEATVRELLDEATRPAERLGDVVAAFARDLDVAFPNLDRRPESIAAADYS